MAKHNEIGVWGEDIAKNWLVRKSHTIITRNYRKKYGEIDIISRETSGMLHFIEVKSVSYETRAHLEKAIQSKDWRPEDNVHGKKQQRFARVIQVWLAENNYNGKWQIDIITVRMVPREKYASIKSIENIVFE